MMALTFQFKKHIDDRFPELRKDRVLLACSGGVDSMVLLNLLLAEGIRPALAHVNYGLRGAESQKDADFVASIARQEHLELHLSTAPAFDLAGNRSPQLWAREFRYAFFEKLMDRYHYPAVLTAHHADDLWETFLINSIRGSGLKGLRGIPEKENRRWRPLLPFSRDEMEAYAEAQQIQWREDQSNAQDKYLRNFIRNQISPRLRERIPDFTLRLRSTQEHIVNSIQLLHNYRELIWNEVARASSGGWSVSISLLKEKEKTQSLLYLLFSPYGFFSEEELRKLMEARIGAQIHSPDYSLTRDRGTLELRETTLDHRTSFWLFEKERSPDFPLDLQLEEVERWEKENKDVLYADKQTLNFPLEVRKWRRGDYFYPSGMTGKKKIAKLYKDEKIPLPDKEKQWLLCSDGEVVWVIGRRTDRRFEVKPNTRKIIKITWRRPSE